MEEIQEGLSQLCSRHIKNRIGEIKMFRKWQYDLDAYMHFFELIEAQIIEKFVAFIAKFFALNTILIMHQK